MGYHKIASSQKKALSRAESDQVSAALAGSSVTNLWALM